MFQSLRQNSLIYILNKDIPSLDMGNVVSVSTPVPKYPANFGQPQNFILDLVVKINGQDVSYQKVPANVDIADFGSGIVISDNKEAMNAEISSLKQKSKDLLESIDFHKKVLEACDKMLKDLNPEYAEKQAQQEEISGLKSQVAELTKNIGELLSRFKNKENGDNRD